jgi:hypothetical protein
VTYTKKGIFVVGGGGGGGTPKDKKFFGPFFPYKIAIFRQQVPIRTPKCNRILKFFYFPLWTVVKFGFIIPHGLIARNYKIDRNSTITKT